MSVSNKVWPTQTVSVSHNVLPRQTCLYQTKSSLYTCTDTAYLETGKEGEFHRRGRDHGLSLQDMTGLYLNKRLYLIYIYIYIYFYKRMKSTKHNRLKQGAETYRTRQAHKRD